MRTGIDVKRSVAEVRESIVRSFRDSHTPVVDLVRSKLGCQSIDVGPHVVLGRRRGGFGG